MRGRDAGEGAAAAVHPGDDDALHRLACGIVKDRERLDHGLALGRLVGGRGRAAAGVGDLLRAGAMALPAALLAAFAIELGRGNAGGDAAAWTFSGCAAVALERSGSLLVATVTGELDASSAPLIGAQVTNSLLSTDREVRLDVGGDDAEEERGHEG